MPTFWRIEAITQHILQPGDINVEQNRKRTAEIDARYEAAVAAGKPPKITFSEPLPAQDEYWSPAAMQQAAHNQERQVAGWTENNSLTNLAAQASNGMLEWQSRENQRLASIILPRDLHTALATAAEGFPAWDVLDAAHMLVASLIVDLVADADRPGFLRKMDRVLRDRVKEIAARQRPRLVV